MIEIRSFRDLLRLFFIFRREFKLAAIAALVIILLGAFLLPAKYESTARLLVKPGRDSTLPIEISNRQALVMPSTQRDPIVDEERLLTGRPIVRAVAEHYLEVIDNAPPPEGFFESHQALRQERHRRSVRRHPRGAGNHRHHRKNHPGGTPGRQPGKELRCRPRRRLHGDGHQLYLG